MEEKKIITTEEELRMLIGLAAADVVERIGEDKEDLIMDVAAGICTKVNGHLTGRKQFSSADIALYKALTSAIDLAEKLSGTVIIR